jgi:2-polyprenyl-6-hydroxyphenyl methylase/3-demethylubiquinone-9 3-methyltransferase
MTMNDTSAPATAAAAPPADGFDHSSDPNFLAYYEKESLSRATIERFTIVRDKALALLRQEMPEKTRLDVADIGCGAGTQAILWAELGHRVHGLDVNGPLVEVARRRAAERGLVELSFDVGTATALPYPSGSADVVLLPELLEHVTDWQACLNEAARILRPGGLLYLSTTNKLCPKQQEFELPMYSWYPGFLKRRYERLAVTTRPEIVNHARYPAIHWFTFFGLRDFLARRDMRSLDRFDMMDDAQLGTAARLVVRMIRKVEPLRWLAHCATPYTVIFALKRPVIPH